MIATGIEPTTPVVLVASEFEARGFNVEPMFFDGQTVALRVVSPADGFAFWITFRPDLQIGSIGSSSWYIEELRALYRVGGADAIVESAVRQINAYQLSLQ
jgi:hypothetical protein